MTQRIILSVISIAMLAFSLQNRDKKSLFLTVGLTVAVLISWMDSPMVMNVDFFLYTAIALLISFFGLANHDQPGFNRVAMFLICIWSVGIMLAGFIHWPYAGEMRLSTLIPLGLYIILLRRGLFHKNEFPYTTILSTGLFLYLLSI